MSSWLEFKEVLVGQGSGEAVTPSPRLRAPPVSSPRARWAPHRQQRPLSPPEGLMGKAKELFELCDKEGKGFITKRDMQRLEGELPLSPEQLETVFESLDREGNGFLTPVEFNTGLGEMGALEQNVEDTEPELEDCDQTDSSHDASAQRFVNTLSELGADGLYRRAELCGLWTQLEADSPALASLLEEVLAHVLVRLQDSIRDRDSLEQALRRRETEHDEMIRSVYEETENQMREEREKHAAEGSLKEKQKNQHLEERLKVQAQELERALNKQRETERSVRLMSCDQSKVNEQNQKLLRENQQLQDQLQNHQQQLENKQQQLQTALNQLSLLQERADLDMQNKQRNVLKVSRNMQKEKDSLLRQLELLRDMNRRMRDEKDVRLESQRRVLPRLPVLSSVPVAQFMYPP
ncbi:unnamed protein product [Knipowitschia caucasica]